MAIVLSRLFMRTISQNRDDNQTGISLWTAEDVQKALEKRREMEADGDLQDDELHGVESDAEDDYDRGGISLATLGEIDMG
jgi:DNA excision repair protein ERCC-2